MFTWYHALYTENSDYVEVHWSKFDVIDILKDEGCMHYQCEMCMNSLLLWEIMRALEALHEA